MSTNLNPRTAVVLLLQGEDADRLEELRDRAEQAKTPAKAPRLMSDEDPYPAAAQAADDFKREAEERAVRVVVRALPRKKWRQLVADHPPRPDHAGDAQFGIHLVDFADALVPASIVEPEFSGDGQRDDFLDSLTDGQFEDVFWKAYRLNRGGGTDPKDWLLTGRSSSATDA